MAIAATVWRPTDGNGESIPYGSVYHLVTNNGKQLITNNNEDIVLNDNVIVKIPATVWIEDEGI